MSDLQWASEYNFNGTTAYKPPTPMAATGAAAGLSWGMSSGGWREHYESAIKAAADSSKTAENVSIEGDDKKDEKKA